MINFTQLNKFLTLLLMLCFLAETVSVAGERSLTADTQNAADNEAQRPIYCDEKKTGEQDHEKNERRRDQGLTAGGPRNLGAFGADLLKEFQRVRHCVGGPSLVCGAFKTAPVREKIARIGVKALSL